MVFGPNRTVFGQSGCWNFATGFVSSDKCLSWNNYGPRVSGGPVSLSTSPFSASENSDRVRKQAFSDNPEMDFDKILLWKVLYGRGLGVEKILGWWEAGNAANWTYFECCIFELFSDGSENFSDSWRGARVVRHFRKFDFRILGKI